MIELFEIERGSEIHILDEVDGSRIIVTFHHLDGLYSYCTYESGGKETVVHLSALTPLKRVGSHYEIDREET